MAITRVVPALIQVANNVTSTTIGNTTSIPSLTFDASGVIIAASNTTVTVSNTNITGTITNSQLGTGAVSNTKIASGAVEQYFADIGYNTQFRNRIINGDMRIDQRNAGASVTPPANTVYYTTDRWKYYLTQSSKLTAQQNAGSVTPPTGFTNYLGTTSSSAYSVISSDIFTVYHAVEGYNVADFGWGSANASTITISFWVRSSLTGTHSGAIQNSANNRSYVFTFTVNSANTWEYKTVTIAGDTSGTWLTTNGIGLSLYFNLGSGSTYSTTAGSWQAGNFIAATGATSVVGTNGATFYLTGVQLEVGSVATPFERRPFGTELALCQRYYFKDVRNNFSAWASGVFYSSTLAIASYTLPVQMRATPTLTSSTITNFRVQGGNYVLTATAIGGTLSTNGGRLDFTVSGATTGQGAIVDTASSGQFLDFSAEL